VGTQREKLRKNIAEESGHKLSSRMFPDALLGKEGKKQVGKDVGRWIGGGLPHVPNPLLRRLKRFVLFGPGPSGGGKTSIHFGGKIR